MRNFNEIFRKDVPCDNFKIHIKPGFQPLFRRYNFWKTTGVGGQIDSSSRFRVKIIIKETGKERLNKTSQCEVINDYQYWFLKIYFRFKFYKNNYSMKIYKEPTWLDTSFPVLTSEITIGLRYLAFIKKKVLICYYNCNPALKISKHS